MANEQYLTEAHYLTCSKGAKPVRVSVDSQKSVKFSGSLAATSKDLQTKSNFICLGAVAFGAGAAVGVVATLSACALIPGPGWVVAAIIAAIIIAALLLAGGKCACAAATRFWLPGTTSQRSKLNGSPLLILSSQMSCPAEGGCITAQATLWEAWGRQTLTNLGHIANFAFGFLVGRGASAMVVEAGAAASVSAAGQTGSQVAGTFIRSLGKNFLNTAKQNLVQQFTGWNQGGMFCRFMKGFGLYGEVKAHYDIWTDDEKSTWEKIKASGMSLILDVFAAKGATLVCFPAGTKVHTQWGLADIEKLEVGVPVLTYNEVSNKLEYKKVKKVMRRMTRRMCALELSNGTTIEVTPEHRFFSNGEWTPIEELNVNDTLQLKDNSIVVIENKIIFPTFVEVYNLEIEDNENYYVTEEGVLVHNGYKGAEPGTPEHKQMRWEEYQENGGKLDYDSWSKKYDVCMQNATKGNAAADAYMEDVGWGKREVTVEAYLSNGDKVSRRLDIADAATQRGIEVKSGNYFSLDKNIAYEVERDAALVQDGWSIEWHIDGKASQPLLDALKEAGITKTP
ncbi:Hint domain-containing protein [Bacteroides heparinolyticus]|uniref:Hint domain-containing protein n=1 Tax=Prevotella heparinolytica TaxID=28113 RepID=UPI0035A1CFCD